ncbi:free fatty acid receptor 3-like [Bombina bombina]|uniref:free fatty acid receptor 3-like n=1 Tax=Bombina bombina TaxID=8345 RepID=UPI00235A54B9|nr:free fatty acid receptor 3-like [Bombina bombina]
MDLERGTEALFLTIYIVTFVTGMPLNLMALFVLAKKFKQRLVSVDIFLFNLTISDLLLLAFLPFRMVEAANGMKWNMPYIFCTLSGYLFFSSIYITSLFLMTISIERYMAVAFPVKYKLYKKPPYAIGASIFIWIFASSHCSVVYIVNHLVNYNKTETNITVCYRNFSPAQLAIVLPVRFEMSLVLFVVPFFVTIYCYLNFIKMIMSQTRIKKKKRQRAIGLVVATLVNFIICFLPYNISHIVGFISHESPKWRDYALLLSVMNASVDPVIFYFSSSSLRNMFLDCLIYVLNKLNLKRWSQICMVTCEKETDDTNVSS